MMIGTWWRMQTVQLLMVQAVVGMADDPASHRERRDPAPGCARLRCASAVSIGSQRLGAR